MKSNSLRKRGLGGAYSLAVVCLVVLGWAAYGFVVPARLGQLTADGHFGLMGLQERLEAVNGALTITSVPGQGTRVEARVPIAG